MNSLCFGCPSGQLALQHVPCDCKLQNAYCKLSEPEVVVKQHNNVLKHAKMLKSVFSEHNVKCLGEKTKNIAEKVKNVKKIRHVG